AACFDFFGDHPFYQATTADYDALVPANKRVAKGKGQVAVKQLNRRISESGHTPSTFAPKTGEFKNEIDLDEFVRWIIMYQNYTGVTDKTKVENEEKFSNPAGWVYRLNPVYVQGKTLFETLMLNLVLVNQDQENPAIQRPVWEFESVLDYVAYRKRQALPDDLAGLYTAWSRILHIEWADKRHPIIFSAGIPMFSAEGARLEPMTTWRFDKKESLFRPAVKSLRSLSVAMWRNFGQYVKTNQDETTRQEPGLVGWLRKLKEDGLIPDNQILTLASVALVSDGNATSQSPAAEFADDLQLQANTLFDDSEMAERWPVRIEDTVTMTQKVGQDFYHFAADIGEIRNLVDTRSYASRLSAKFYASLNVPFKQWLAQLSGRDDRDEKINEWKRQLQELLRAAVQEIVRTSSSRDVIGIKDAKGRPMNIFTVRSRLSYQVRQDLDLKKE
ncbi:type I-E CRISPR-associated protein Cse1/CasA, partial [Levilactobacillus namurensis]|uniref:type I-E CRISPR-associated protein Cse1/CasA n=1 Tax=Levilactobacillus namurensis TaxID=380393 RepID=UPI0011BF4EEE